MMVIPFRHFVPHRLSPAGLRLWSAAASASATVLTAVLAAFALWTLASGGGWADLAAPAAGAVLAFTAEMLCLDLAIRRVERFAAPAAAGERMPAREAASV